MSKGKLLRADQSELAAKIREAIGAGPSESVTIATPDFERPPNWKPPEHAPRLPSEWQALRVCTKDELRAMGMGNWNGKLMLFPQEWYPFIPEDFEITNIMGRQTKFKRGVTDDDIRFGCLAYGVNAVDGVAEQDS